MFVSTVSSFMANVTKGYLAPIGIIFLIVLLINVVNKLDWLSASMDYTEPAHIQWSS